MFEIEFAYEITRRNFAEANAAISRHSRRSNAVHVVCITACALLLLLLPFTYKEADIDWTYPLLVVPFGLYLLYLAVLWVSPFLSGMVAYNTNLTQRKFQAYLSQEVVKVSGEHNVWTHQWPSFQVILETKTLFIFYDGIVMYIFAKQYFTGPQIECLRGWIKDNKKSMNLPASR